MLGVTMRFTGFLAGVVLGAVIAAPASAYKVGLVFDVGGRGDKSFNDSAFRGLEKARRELSVDVEYIEPSETSDRESALRQFASGSCDLVIGVGFIFTDDINRVAKAFPNKLFAGVDYSVTPGKEPPANVIALKFREQESSFLGGVIAAMSSKSKVIGFIGGMDTPIIHKFEAGYRAGAHWAVPQIKILSAYAGVTPEAFRDPSKGKELALSQIGQGADVIHHASGSTGLGVFEAARDKKILAIGVDSDQYLDAPGFVLTSVTKQIDTAVFNTVKSAMAGKARKGVIELGLKDKGVDYVYDAHNKSLVTVSAHAKAEEARALIIAGKIKVPTQ